MAKNSETTECARKEPVGQKPKPRRSSHGRTTPVPPPRRKTETPHPRRPGPEPGIQPETVVTTFNFRVNPTLTLVCVPVGTPALFSLGVAADLAGVHPDTIAPRAGHALHPFLSN